MKNVIILLLAANLLMAYLASAENEQNDQAVTNEQIEQMLLQNPAAAFAANQERAWQAIENNPNLLANPRILDAAFDNDYNREKAGIVLNNNPELLTDANVVAKFEEAAQGDIEFLNNPAHQRATVFWLQNKYQLSMESGAVFANYDKPYLTTVGRPEEDEEIPNTGTHFNINDFPGARINADGTLTYQEGKFKSTTISVNHATGHIEMNGGEVDARGDIEIEATNGLAYMRECPAGPTRQQCLGASGGDYLRAGGREVISFSGDFVLSRQNNVIRVSNTESSPEGFVYNRDLKIIGTIIRPPHARTDEFIIDGNAELRMFHQDQQGSTFEESVMQVQSNSQVYVSRQGGSGRGEATFCREGFSCIVDTGSIPGPDQARLAFIGMTHNDQVTFATPIYYAHVEVINTQSGQVTIQSVSSNNQVLGTVRAGVRDDISAQGTALEQINFGRIDVLYPQDDSCTGEGCPKTLHHWSSNLHQSDTAYFQAARQSYLGRQRESSSIFLRCTLGRDCEESVARNFGKVIGIPTGGTARTTIIVAGDNAVTARSLEPWCRNNGGCYIINSRDVTTTTSENLIVTGHNFPEDPPNIWRESLQRVGTEHAPVDRLYFNPVSTGSPFDHLPQGNQVQSITFSACNTAVNEQRNEIAGELLEDPAWRRRREAPTILGQLLQQYPNVHQVQGWDGTARLLEEIDNPFVEPADIRNQPPYRNPNSPGSRAWYIQLENSRGEKQWYWTDDGISCALQPGGERGPCPFQERLAQR